MSIDKYVKELKAKHRIGRIKIRLGHDGTWAVYIDWNPKDDEVTYPMNAQGSGQTIEEAFKSAREKVGKQ